MTNSSKPKRTYNSTHRQAQARQTRQHIADAARGLFIQRGYAGATIEAIAEAAGVATETVYTIFGSKRKILMHLFDTSLGGDDAPVGILERPDPQAMFQEKDQIRQLQMFARGIATIMERVAPVFEIMRIAAKTEPDIDGLLQHILKERWQNLELVMQRVAVNGPLRAGINTTQAADTAWTLTSAEVFLLLTVNRGLSKEQYIVWLADSLIRLLLP
ncbi:MAG TPA: TetR/AcrR family transcriptional regulator [Phototrophicaceae bacterium]|jgi:AcrR family transcriptional regulator|nr:TetR/AcrR family transcriptional regulator [Phototrophicaceae bacterium]